MNKHKSTKVKSIEKPSSGVTRRKFLEGAGMAAAFSIVPGKVLGGAGKVAPSEKTTLAGVGVGGQGLQDMAHLMKFPEMQVVAVCDVDKESGGFLSWNWSQGKEQKLGGREPARRMIEEYYSKQKDSGNYKGCKAYCDYKDLLGKEDVDAVMVATPDHNHAVVTMAALKLKKHVYCEKPLTYSVYEARMVTEEAKKAGVATQLGNQGQAEEIARITCELIQAGAIGPVREMQVWNPPRFWEYPCWPGRPPETPPVPEGLNWDMWLGPAPERPYHPAYCPWTWRNWWDFGTGLLGDLGCHKLSTGFKALKLEYPKTIEACSTKLNSEIYPQGVIARFEFAARGDMPPLTLNWYDGGLKPARPKELEPGRRMATIFYIGDKGTMMGHRIIPDAKMKAFGRPPKTLPRSPGHYKEWVDACRGGKPAGSNFVDHGGRLTELCMLGNVAVRAGKKIEWDGPKMRITNDEAANKLLHRTYREGWSL